MVFGKPQKSYLFSGPTTKALTPPPLSSLLVTFFSDFFLLEFKKKLFFLRGPVGFFAAFLKPEQILCGGHYYMVNQNTLRARKARS